MGKVNGQVPWEAVRQRAPSELGSRRAAAC
jgi:hypothetical protein